jgi:hypothetical protein
MTYTELIEALKAKRVELEGLFAKHRGDDGKFHADIPDEVVAEIEAKSAEVESLDLQAKALEAKTAKVADLEAKNSRIVVRERPNVAPVQSGDAGAAPEFTDLKSAFADFASKSDRDIVSQLSRPGGITLDVDAKAVMSTGAGWAPGLGRGAYVGSPQRTLDLLDVMPTIESWPLPTYTFPLESTMTNAAAERAESVEATASAFAESTFVTTMTDVSLRMIGHSLPVSMEQLEDVGDVTPYLNDRMIYGVRRRLNDQIIVGNGTAPNIRGLRNFAGINTGAKGSQTNDDALAAAIASVQANGETTPNTMIVHPTDYQKFRQGKSATGDPIAWDPTVGYVQPLFGLMPIITTAMTQGRSLVFDSAYTILVYKRGVVLEVTNAHASDFTNGIVRFRASVRAGLALTRVTAVYELTGL